ncbi:DNA polymerase III subunit delta [Candidatus Poribacteria bacterium]|nr:DNA polymerase III subunit delta [Candidatus Poribacteria bacterium]
MGKAKNIIQDIERGKVHPVYLLHGEENYLIDDTLTEMINHLAPKDTRDFNLDIVSDPEISVSEILAMSDTYPVMAERRIIVIKDPAFLGTRKKIDPVELLQESKDSYRSGNASRAASILARVIDLDFEDFSEDSTSLKRAIDAFKKENGNSLSDEDLEYLDERAEKLITKLNVVFHSPGSGDVDRFIEYLKEGPPTTSVMILAVTSQLNSRSKVVKTIDSVGKVINFTKFRSSYYVNKDPMYQMVVDKLKENKKTIAPDAFSELQKKTGNNMRQMFDELNKLVTFVGERSRIEKSDVEDLVSRTEFDGIFDLTDAIGKRSLPLALASLRGVLEKGDHPILIHAMLTRQIRFLLQAKLLMENGYIKTNVARMSYNVFQKNAYKNIPSNIIEKLPESKTLNLLKQHPYPLHNTLRQAGNFTVDELIKAMKRLLEADIQLKSGSLTPELVVEMLVVDLVGKR